MSWARPVLIAPAGSQIKPKIAPHFPLAAALGDGRLATGDPDSVPVGRYARSALTALGVWDEVAARRARAENVAAPLMYVGCGEAPLGIVYASTHPGTWRYWPLRSKFQDRWNTEAT